MKMNLQFSIGDLTVSPVSLCYFSSVEDLDVNIKSVEATATASDDSDIGVQQQTSITGRQMTTDLVSCANGEVPDFPWDDFDSILQMTEDRADPLDRGGAGPSETLRRDSPPFRHCQKLRRQVDTPLSASAHERGPN